MIGDQGRIGLAPAGCGAIVVDIHLRSTECYLSKPISLDRALHRILTSVYGQHASCTSCCSALHGVGMAIGCLKGIGPDGSRTLSLINHLAYDQRFASLNGRCNDFSTNRNIGGVILVYRTVGSNNGAWAVGTNVLVRPGTELLSPHTALHCVVGLTSSDESAGWTSCTPQNLIIPYSPHSQMKILHTDNYAENSTLVRPVCQSASASALAANLNFMDARARPDGLQHTSFITHSFSYSMAELSQHSHCSSSSLYALANSFH